MLISRRTRRNIILFFLTAVLINLIDMFSPKDCLNGREDKLPAAEILRLYSSFESKLEARLHIPYSVILSEAEDLPAGGIECPS